MGINAVEEFVTAEAKLSGLWVTTAAQMEVADDLPVARIDFLLLNDLGGGRACVPTPLWLWGPR